MITRSTVVCFALLAFASTSVVAQSTLGLSVNGQTVVPRGQLESFVYDLGASRIQARSFFGDIRCAPADQGTAAPSSLAFELDMFSSKESEAIYEIFEDGEVRYDIAAGMIDVTTSTDPGFAACTHFIAAVGDISSIEGNEGEADPGTFWSGDFESPISLKSETITPAVIDGELSIRFTMTNTSKVLVATEIDAPFAFGITPSTTEITGPDYSPLTGDPDTDGSNYVLSNVTGNVWEIPFLWPGESAAVVVSYTLLSTAPADVEIETTVDSVTALDRTDAAPLAISTPPVTVMEVSSTAL